MHIYKYIERQAAKKFAKIVSGHQSSEGEEGSQNTDSKVYLHSKKTIKSSREIPVKAHVYCI